MTLGARFPLQAHHRSSRRPGVAATFSVPDCGSQNGRVRSDLLRTLVGHDITSSAGCRLQLRTSDLSSRARISVIAASQRLKAMWSDNDVPHNLRVRSYCSRIRLREWILRTSIETIDERRSSGAIKTEG
jgi:hypothetical protein